MSMEEHKDEIKIIKDISLPPLPLDEEERKKWWQRFHEIMQEGAQKGVIY